METKTEIFGTIIIGSGPAATSAAVYASRALLKTLIITGDSQGQLTTTSLVENFIGFESISGYDLSQKFLHHAVSQGAILAQDEVVTDIEQDKESRRFTVTTNTNKYITMTVIVATGASAKMLHLPSEKLWWHRGISACAVCDGSLPRFRNKPLAVVGGGDTAMEAASWLSTYSDTVYLIHRSTIFRASKIMQKKVMNNTRIRILYNSTIVDACGSDKDGLTSILVSHNSEPTITTTTLQVRGLFYAIGHTPNTQFLKKNFGNILDTEGYVITPDLTNQMSSVKGIFAAGDVRDKIYRQAITASGEGTKAAINVAYFIGDM